MLRKIIKFDLRANGRFMWPLFVCMILCGGLAGVSIGSVFSFSDFEDSSIIETLFDSTLANIMKSSLVLVGVAFSFLIVVAVGVAFFANLWRFYKSMYSQEGYFTNTLPVSARTHLSSKLLTGGLWVFLSVIAAIIAYFVAGSVMMLFIEDLDFLKLVKEVFDEIVNVLLQVMPGFDLIFVIVESVILLITQIAASLLVAYMAVSVGCRITNKMKVFVSIALYFAVNLCVSVIQRIIFGFVIQVFEEYQFTNFSSAIHLLLISSIILNVIFGVVGWIVTYNSTSKHLNLE